MERQGACRGPDTSKPEVVLPQKTFMSSGSWQGPGAQPWTKAAPRCQRGRPLRDGNPCGRIRPPGKACTVGNYNIMPR
jgi:hypothetical protein